MENSFRNKEELFADRYLLLVFVIAAGVASLIHFPEIISLSGRYGKDTLFPGIRGVDVFSEVFFTFVSLLVLFGINAFLFRFTRRNTPFAGWKVLLGFVATWLASSLLGQLFVFLHHRYQIPAIDATVHQYLHPVRDFVLSTVATGSVYMIVLIRQKQQVLVENEQLHAENILTQFEALKHQLNPHMLFNSLNTLRSLVRESPVKAQSYIQELSRVLRYTLQGNDTQTVSLKEELDFVKAYCYLLEMRYEENLRVEIVASERFGSYRVPPMSVQMLVENAVKHNEISNRHPLVIRIVTEEDEWLSVYNRLQPKLTPVTDTRIGLANLDKRYRLLYKQGIHIFNDTELFRVRIPLISPGEPA